jgi:hypothetical protein
MLDEYQQGSAILPLIRFSSTLHSGGAGEMRHTTRALLSLLLVIGCCHSSQAETSGWRLWPFGGKQEDPSITAAAPTTTAPTFTPSPGLPPSADITPVTPDLPLPQSDLPKAATARVAAPIYATQEQAPATQFPQNPKEADRLPFFGAPLPTIQWPKAPTWPLSSKRSSPPAATQAQTDSPPRNAWVEKPPEPPKPTPLQSVKNGAHRVADSTRNAWRKTVDAVTPGDQDHRTGARIASRDVKPPFWQRMMGTQETERDEQTVSGFVGQPRP